MNILVCGGAGYIGSQMCKILAEHGHAVTIFDNFSTGHSQAVCWGDAIKGNLLSPQDLEKAFAKRNFEAVFHFAACSLVEESFKSPEFYYEQNVTGTLNLLECMAKYNVRLLVFSSTAAVYGIPEVFPVHEGHPLKPVSPYGYSKMLIEQMLPLHDYYHGLRAVSLRYFNAAGADAKGQLGESHKPETHLIPKLLKWVESRESRPFDIYGNDYNTPDGTCLRDYVHVEDLCHAHLLALEYLKQGGASDCFNLGNGKGFSILEVLQAVQLVTKAKIRTHYSVRRLGDPSILVADSRKAQRVLGWRPTYTGLEAIIETAWRWAQHPLF